MCTIPKASAVPSASLSSAGNAPPSHELGQSLTATQSALRCSQRELRIRNRVAEIFLTVPDQEMYGEVLQVVLEALASKYGVFGYIDENGAIVRASMTRDVWEQCQVPCKDIVCPPEQWGGIWGRALTEKKSLYSNEPGRVPEGHIPILNSLAVPIIHRKRLIGLLHVANKEAGYDDSDQRLLETIAGHIAPILRARLQRDRQERRRRLAEEELRRHRDRLEELIYERTADLTQTNERLLREAEKRRLAEEALRASESRFRQVLELSTDLIYRLDFESRTYDYVSPSVLRLSGFTEKEFAALGIHGIRHRVHPEDWPAFKRRLAEVLEPRSDDGEGRGHEYRWQCKDGQYRWFHEHVAFVRGDDERLLAMVGTVRDITERRESEEALRASEERFSKAFHGAPLAIAISRVGDGNIIDANEDFLRMIGYEREEVVGHTSQELGLFVDAGDRGMAVRAVEGDGASIEREFKIRTKSGEIRDVLTAFMKVEIGGEPCFMGMSRDITERKHAEEALRQSEQRFSRVFHSAPVAIGIARIDDGRFVDVNESFLDLVGYDREEVIGRTSAELGLWAEQADRDLMLRTLIQQVPFRDFESTVRRKSGEIRDTLSSFVTVEIDGEPCVIGMSRDVTQRKRAEEALHQSEERLRNVLDVSRDFIYKLDLRNGTYDYASPYVLELTGFTPEEVVAMGLEGFGERIHPEDGKRLIEEVADLTEDWDEGQRNTQSAYRFRRKDGEYRWFSDNSVFIRYSNEQPAALIGAVRDITAEKQTDEALRESENRFRQVLEASSDAICRVSVPSGVCEYVSPAVLPLTGFTQEEFAALGVHAYRHRIHPEDWPKYRQRVKKLVAGFEDETASRHEYRWLCKNGQYRWFADSVAPVRDDDGRPLALVFTGRDTTERREAEEALRQSEVHFRELSASSPVGVFRSDAEGRAVYTNERLREITGLTLDQNLGLGWTAVVHPDDREAALAERSKAIASGQQYTLEFRLQTPHQGIRWVRVHSRPILSTDGLQIGRVGTLEDITEHKEAEERERRLHEQEARTRELRTTVRLLEQMAATLGHELRNPLGVISNSAYFLSNQAGISDARARKHAEIIDREVKSARRVIDDILEFARTPQILLSPASPNVIVDQALARSQIPANIRLTRRLAPDVPPLVCDAERLERAFLDIIANAVQAMPHGGRLSVRTQLTADSVTVVFSDTGEGIAPQNLAKAFDPMFTTKLRGIGLGLTVVRRTVEQHGGQVELKSKLGHGTSVIITLPPADSASGNSVPADAPGPTA